MQGHEAELDVDLGPANLPLRNSLMSDVYRFLCAMIARAVRMRVVSARPARPCC